MLGVSQWPRPSFFSGDEFWTADNLFLLLGSNLTTGSKHLT